MAMEAASITPWKMVLSLVEGRDWDRQGWLPSTDCWLSRPAPYLSVQLPSLGNKRSESSSDWAKVTQLIYGSIRLETPASLTPKPNFPPSWW